MEVGLERLGLLLEGWSRLVRAGSRRLVRVRIAVLDGHASLLGSLLLLHCWSDGEFGVVLDYRWVGFTFPL